jgi:hypothetical protein
MKLAEFNPNIDVDSIGDCDVVGLDHDLVVHFNADDGTIYNTGLTLQDWLDGHSEAWLMLEEEAKRVGIVDYAAYETRVAPLFYAERRTSRAAFSLNGSRISDCSRLSVLVHAFERIFPEILTQAEHLGEFRHQSELSGEFIRVCTHHFRRRGFPETVDLELDLGGRVVRNVALLHGPHSNCSRSPDLCRRPSVGSTGDTAHGDSR